MESSASSVKASDLREDVLAVVIGHFHSLIVVSEGGIRHLERLHRHGAHSSEIRLIALVLQDCFLSQLDSVLLFHFTDHVFQELQLILLFDDLRINLDLDLLLDALLVILVAGHLRKDLQAL